MIISCCFIIMVQKLVLIIPPSELLSASLFANIEGLPGSALIQAITDNAGPHLQHDSLIIDRIFSKLNQCNSTSKRRHIDIRFHLHGIGEESGNHNRGVANSSASNGIFIAELAPQIFEANAANFPLRVQNFATLGELGIEPHLCNGVRQERWE